MAGILCVRGDPSTGLRLTGVGRESPYGGHPSFLVNGRRCWREERRAFARFLTP